MASQDRTVGAEPWDTEWAAQKAADALRYLGRNAPEVLENTSVLEPHEEAAHTRPPCAVTRSPTWRPSEAIAGPAETRPCAFVGVRREHRGARHHSARNLAPHGDELRVPVHRGGPLRGLGRCLVFRGHALGVRHRCRGAVREAPLGGGVTDRWAKRARERRARRKASEEAERRLEELREAWRRRRADEEEGKKRWSDANKS
jgi:hypothetical protein